MPRKGLSSRLRQLRSAREPVSPTPSDRTTVPAVSIAGFERCGEFLYRRVSFHPEVSPPAAASGLLIPADTPFESLLFFDLETTGLSGGAGTVAFLAGFGRYTGAGFTIEQYFLSDYPGEPELLARIGELLAPGIRLVSYNGRAFDANLLVSRGLMNGMRFRMPAHTDLLYPTRRLWRRLIGSCSLSNIEERVLGVRRDEDIPGAEVPERWFAFLADGRDEGLREVFSHHRQDILSLALLLGRLEAIFADPSAETECDRRNLGLYLLARGDARGEELLEAAWKGGEPEAGALLALARKRAGDWERASTIWNSLAAAGAGPAVLEELAKYHEHRTGRCDLALEFCEAGLERSLAEGRGERLVAAFEYRRGRLLRKLEARR